MKINTPHKVAKQGRYRFVRCLIKCREIVLIGKSEITTNQWNQSCM